MFDVGLETVLYAYNIFLGPNNIIHFAVENNVNPERVPTVFLSNVASSSGLVVQYHVYINKTGNEPVTGFAVSVVYDSTKFSAFDLSNRFILQTKTTITTSIVCTSTIVSVVYDDPTSDSFLNTSSNLVSKVELTAVGIVAIYVSDFYLMFASYTQYDTSFPVSVTQYNQTIFTYIPEVPISPLISCSLSQSTYIL